ncbi:MAG: acyl-CoA thioesterase [Gaiellaceae bacterium]
MYFDEARDAFLTATVGPFEEFPWVIAHVSIDYEHEIVHPAREVIVQTQVTEVGRTSVTFEQHVVGSESEIAARSRSVLVAWDAATRASRAIADDERAKLLRRDADLAGDEHPLDLGAVVQHDDVGR